ncbi:uncharacterized protein E5676_scaffold1251G00820 [Cucumis melo var. makuwa]|uniref:Uncharacterized protein n=1 Tax=Cucumis melo var. makuwa TaxID=1194695 RepID=A0A5A7TSC4_CUCMM|nr:uncharacterized protein E6C27_scaffold543G00120 [Cucumis melo var. makuwa]TYJ97770.1 uncharacterized protein E5676_scaffold1251G00820 [Cucumis melo var. makuwa]
MVTEEAKVTLVTMHLSDDDKLWWRSWYVDIQEGRCTICIWDDLKKEHRLQFFLENVEILARRKLRELKHTDRCKTSSKFLVWEKQEQSLEFSKTVKGDKRSNGDRKPYQPNTGNTWRGPNNQNVSNCSLSCFICKGQHLARKCPNKTAFNAFQSSLASDSDDKLSQTEREVD